MDEATFLRKLFATRCVTCGASPKLEVHQDSKHPDCAIYSVRCSNHNIPPHAGWEIGASVSLADAQFNPDAGATVYDTLLRHWAEAIKRDIP